MLDKESFDLKVLAKSKINCSDVKQAFDSSLDKKCNKIDKITKLHIILISWVQQVPMKTEKRILLSTQLQSYKLSWLQARKIGMDVQVELMEGMTDLYTCTRTLTNKVGITLITKSKIVGKIRKKLNDCEHTLSERLPKKILNTQNNQKTTKGGYIKIKY